jgi:hypothetical protein
LNFKINTPNNEKSLLPLNESEAKALESYSIMDSLPEESMILLHS